MMNATREKTRLWLLILIGVVATLIGQTHAREIFAPSPHESGIFATQTPASTGEIYDGIQYDAPDSSLAAKSAGQLGREGEAAIQAATGLSKNTESFIVNGRSRIPDFVTARGPSGAPTGLIEAKNVQYQSLTSQLRDYRDLVGAGGRVDVALPAGSRVSGPLQRAFADLENPLFRMDLPR